MAILFSFFVWTTPGPARQNSFFNLSKSIRSGACIFKKDGTEMREAIGWLRNYWQPILTLLSRKALF
ncbi:MAG: hypothetical protein H6577_16960 [Lewinellaceae bacterium]|nr:hypothetical protein [Saprospiraceae bacterium]MCB9339817.1 hypothetical protein [Lewinellaceae bacterium]